MRTKTEDEPRTLEGWQLDDAARLRALFDKKKAHSKAIGERFTQATFAENTGIASPNMVWQFLSAHRPLNIQAAAEFAKGLGVAVHEFSPTLATQIDQVAEVKRPATNEAKEPTKAPSRKLQYVDDWEAELLSHCRATNDQGRETIMESAEEVPHVLLDELAAHQAKKDRR